MRQKRAQLESMAIWIGVLPLNGLTATFGPSRINFDIIFSRPTKNPDFHSQSIKSFIRTNLQKSVAA